MNLDKKVLERIDKENIRMIPGWFFILKDSFLNVCWIVAFLGSAVSFGMLIKWLNMDARIAMFWLVGFILLLAVSFGSAWRVNFKSLYKYGLVSLVAFVSFSSAMGFAIYSTKETGKIEVYMERIPVYKAILQENAQELDLENLENQNMELKDDQISSEIGKDEDNVKSSIFKETDEDGEESDEVENKKMLKEDNDDNEDKNEDDKKSGGEKEIEDQGLIMEKKTADKEEKEEDNDEDENENLIENDPQIKGVEKEQDGNNEEDEVIYDQEENTGIDADDVEAVDGEE